MSEEVLPSLETVTKLVQCLLGDGVQARTAEKGPDTSKPWVIATYVDDNSTLRRIIACDLALANSLGAAFSMIPAGLAADSTKAGTMPENIRGNLHEVLNVCVNLFTANSKDRLALSDLRICSGGTAAPAMKNSARFAVQVPRYAGGTLLAGSV